MRRPQYLHRVVSSIADSGRVQLPCVVLALHMVWRIVKEQLSGLVYLPYPVNIV